MHDIAIIGLGALGVHAAASAARRGLDIVGIETHQPAHERGATGGRTRIFRMVYTFGGDYLPALLEAGRAWDRLEARHPGRVLHRHGALLIGSADDPELIAASSSALQHGIPHEVLTEARLAERWGQHRLLPADIAIADPGGALLLPQSITAAVSQEAVEAGARLHYGDAATTIEPIAGGTEVVCESGRRVRARRLIVAAGAWSSGFAPELDEAIELRRVVLQWFSTSDPAAASPARFPVGLRRSGVLRYSFFPQTDADGIKINLHLPKAAVGDVAAGAPPVADDYGSELEPLLRQTLPGIERRTRVASFVEGYTSDYRIVLDRIAGFDDAWVLAGGSGQAFKFAPVLAEHALDLALEDEPRLALEGVVRRISTTSTKTVVGP
ncbi:FAD-dependent oxidoreductase [Agrococcus baldri]|uniref:Sarcosine oxidase n=1 Tax=Agrococcus baldri TaxID=153730 RepID=A0AA87RAI4_9MICO|nr:FAD-dependent oxidoreductase [Agrococcus baldri]GEK79534.1 sarcosine oxidase [Agrococcus baldri]